MSLCRAISGKFLPEKAKLNAPVYFSTSQEKITPKYNPLDQDIHSEDALDAVATRHERDSIKSFAISTKENREPFDIEFPFQRAEQNPDAVGSGEFHTDFLL